MWHSPLSRIPFFSLSALLKYESGPPSNNEVPYLSTPGWENPLLPEVGVFVSFFPFHPGLLFSPLPTLFYFVLAYRFFSLLICLFPTRTCNYSGIFFLFGPFFFPCGFSPLSFFTINKPRFLWPFSIRDVCFCLSFALFFSFHVF